MNPEILSTSVQELINTAIGIAQTRKNPTLLPLHLLAAGVSQEFCLSFFSVFGIDIQRLRLLIDQELAKLPRVEGSQLTGDRALDEFLQACDEGSSKLLGIPMLPLSILCYNGGKQVIFLSHYASFFKQTGVTRQALLQHMQSMRKGKKVNEKNAEKQYQILEKYCQNITKQARDGKLDPVIGRHEEIRRVIQILSRRTKNNPVLIGEPGVGKTAIVEGIAQRIINNDVPESLKNNIFMRLILDF